MAPKVIQFVMQQKHQRSLKNYGQVVVLAALTLFGCRAGNSSVSKSIPGTDEEINAVIEDGICGGGELLSDIPEDLTNEFNRIDVASGKHKISACLFLPEKTIPVNQVVIHFHGQLVGANGTVLKPGGMLKNKYTCTEPTQKNCISKLFVNDFKWLLDASLANAAVLVPLGSASGIAGYPGDFKTYFFPDNEKAISIMNAFVLNALNSSKTFQAREQGERGIINDSINYGSPIPIHLSGHSGGGILIDAFLNTCAVNLTACKAKTYIKSVLLFDAAYVPGMPGTNSYFKNIGDFKPVFYANTGLPSGCTQFDIGNLKQHNIKFKTGNVTPQFSSNNLGYDCVGKHYDVKSDANMLLIWKYIF